MYYCVSSISRYNVHKYTEMNAHRDTTAQAVVVCSFLTTSVRRSVRQSVSQSVREGSNVRTIFIFVSL
jgi:hypothetical protein